MNVPKREDLIKISDYIWEIPRSFRSDMKVSARVFASEEMLSDLFKDRSLWQLVNLTTLPGAYQFAVAMPDIHEGYGSPIGGVVGFDSEEGIISPGMCGYDINCGVRLLVSQFFHQEIKEKISKLTEEIYRQVPSGVGRGGFWKLNQAEMKNVLERGAEWLLEIGYAEKEDLEHTEENGKLEGADWNLVSDQAKKRGRDQLGTIGAGNHFVEIQKVQEIYNSEIAQKLNLEEGKVTIMIHCGSRGLGHQIATDYIRKALKYLQKHQIGLVDRELAYFPLSSEEAKEYFSAMKAGANFAWANRQLIAWEIRKAFQNIFGKNVELKQIYDLAHNIVKLETYFGKKLFVHRKGATRSFPRGHTLLSGIFYKIGQPVLIPGSMGTASFVLIGSENSLKLSFGSSCHGAGRIMSRSESKRKIRGTELKKELERRGIVVAAGSMSGLAEEAPMAYKDVSEVVEVVHQLGLAKKVAKLVPIGVIKG